MPAWIISTATEECVPTAFFATKEGRLYRFNDGLISCGLTDEQAELLQKLTPKELASEAELEALKAAGEIIPGQLYYIAETE